MQKVDTGMRTFTSGEAISQYLRVKFSSGKIVKAGLTDKELGVVTRDVAAQDELVAVDLRNKQGTLIMVASAALAVGANVFTAASGKVGASATGAFLIGTALTAATGDGSLFEVLPNVHGDTAA